MKFFGAIFSQILNKIGVCGIVERRRTPAVLAVNISTVFDEVLYNRCVVLRCSDVKWCALVVISLVDVLGDDDKAAYGFEIAVRGSVAQSDRCLQLGLVVFSRYVFHSWVFVEEVDVAVD